ncbi:MAG: CHRD domain-containing protein [Candidatus Accumulibacter propinquus]|jgi:hypothetical protein|uniref:CHRD domain-containing protein n=1 Tax=Candidatus Accumulibacter propinquus TaxID=2954380 RepID=UPI002FC3D160
MKRPVLVLAMAAAMLLAAPVGHAAIISLYADLNGANEAPPNASPGTGFASVSVDTATHLMHVHVDFRDLLGTTTAAHIHCCTSLPLTGTVGVATTVPNFTGFPLGVTSGLYEHDFDLGLTSSYNPSFLAANGGTAAAAEAVLLAGMTAGRSYLNIHTTFRSGGEIRGFLVPEPAMISLLTLGLGLGFVSLRRKHTGED